LITVIVGLQIYPAPWNVVKAAYIFSRCYPIAVAPFHLWGLVGDHDQHFCESYYHVLYVCAMPGVRLLLLLHEFFSRFVSRCYHHNVSAHVHVLYKL
jgi:hypothetical protein